MARPDQESIDTFISITGASEPVALQILQEHAGNLNGAVNAYFSEGDRNITHPTSITEDQEDLMDIDDPTEDESRRPLPARTTNPFSILNSNLSGNVIESGSHSREVNEIPVVVKDSIEQSGHSGLAPTIQDVSGSAHRQGSSVNETVIIDDEDEEDIVAAPIAQVAPQHEGHNNILRSYADVTNSRPSAPIMDDLPDYGNDIEEEMIRAAIEASKRDTEISYSDQSAVMRAERQSHIEDPELAHAVNLSLKAAEQDNAVRNVGEKVGPSELESLKSAGMEELGKTANGRLEVGGSSTQDEAEEIEDQPLVRHRSRQMSAGTVDSSTDNGDTEVNPPSSPQNDDRTNQPQDNENDFRLEEWGGISSLEHDEAVMLEAALFGGIPEGSAYRAPYVPHQFMQNGVDGIGGHPWRAPRPPSPSLTAQRLIREQQDDEYLASLQADREKAEIRLLEEQAAREAALEEERIKEEESLRKLQEEQEMERQLAAKEASLPNEPTPDDENAVNLLVRMPDGSRRGRRFLKSHKLQSLFDFIDVSRLVKPGTYRLVRPYPRRAFGDGESSVTFSELGLTSRQEALFLELV